MKQYRLRLLLTGVLTLLLIWAAWPERGASLDPISEDANDVANVRKPGTTARERIRIRTKREQRDGIANPADKIGMQRIDRAIEDQSLTGSQAAEVMHSVARDSAYSVNLRSEALVHGVLLDLSVFADMAEDPELPMEMAEELLTAVANENDKEALQIRAYMGFLNHPSEEIRDDATSLLAFVLEPESEQPESEQPESDQPDKESLLKAAISKLKELEE